MVGKRLGEGEVSGCGRIRRGINRIAQEYRGQLDFWGSNLSSPKRGGSSFYTRRLSGAILSIALLFLVGVRC